MTGAEALLPPPIPPRTTLAMQQSSLTSPPPVLSPPAPTSIALPPLPGRREMARKRSRSEGYVLSIVPAGKGGKDSESSTGRLLPPPESLESEHQSEQSYAQVAKKNSDRMKVIGEESTVTRKSSRSPIGRPQSVDSQEVTSGKESSSVRGLESVIELADSKLRNKEFFDAPASQGAKYSAEKRDQLTNLQTASRLTADSNETSKSRAQKQQVKTAEDCDRRLAPMEAKAICDAIDKSRQSLLKPGAPNDRQSSECRHESRVSFRTPAEPAQQSKQLSGQDFCQDHKASKSSLSQRSFKGMTGKLEDATFDLRTQRRKQSKSFAECNMGSSATPEKFDKPPGVLQTSDAKTEVAAAVTTYMRSSSHGTSYSSADQKPSSHSRTPVPCLSTRARISPSDHRDTRRDQQQVVVSSSSSDSSAATPSDIAQEVNLETTCTSGENPGIRLAKTKWPPPQTPKKPSKKTNDGD